ncbi:MAG: hypothetical protein J6U64_05600, partial [Alphaproteobacteria bacterium]|nr:hypothetical protein [Alphaproteobacteria bacterium]
DLGGCCAECPTSCPDGYSLTPVGKCYECQPTCNPDMCGPCETCDVQLNKCVTACADGFQCCAGECIEKKCKNDCYKWNESTCDCDLICGSTEQCCDGKCVDTTACDADACMEWGVNECRCISSCTGSDECCNGKCYNKYCSAITGDTCQEWDEESCSCKECAVSGGSCCDGYCCPTCPSEEECKADNGKCRVSTDEGCWECAECCVEEECSKTACHGCVDGKCENLCKADEE